MILTLNIGTSSIKAGLFDTNDNFRELVKINTSGELQAIVGEILHKTDKKVEEITAFGLRVVHGGETLFQPTIVTSEVLSYLQSIQYLAPLHNPPVIKAMNILKEAYPSIPLVAVFDTGFHTSMPDKAKKYAIPQIWEKNYHVKRYGFHGLAHTSMLETYCSHTNKPKQETTIITVQLGSGCSMCAIKNGVSVDTSMGFSPLEGLISRTRSGDVDPAIVSYLAHQTKHSADEILDQLNHDSGLAGLSETDGDIRSVLSDLESTKNQLAVELFIYRIQKYLGAYDAILEGADAFVFAGGISEHNYELIEGIFTNPFYGVSPLHREKSEALIQQISAETSRRHAYIVKVDEEKEIAKSVNLALTRTV